MVVIHNRLAAGALDSMNVFKICRRVHHPNIRHVHFDELALLGNNSTDGSLGRQHRKLSEPFFDIYGSVNAPPVGDEVLIELASLVLRLVTTITIREFEAANTNKGAVIMNQRALRGIYNWREVNAVDFVESNYHKPRWSNGTEMIEDEANGFRGTRLRWKR